VDPRYRFSDETNPPNHIRVSVDLFSDQSHSPHPEYSDIFLITSPHADILAAAGHHA